MNTSSARDQELRTLARRHHTRILTWPDGEDAVDWKVRLPGTVFRGQLEMLFKGDPIMQLIASVMACTYIPGTHERVWGVGDLDALMAEPCGGLVDTLGCVVGDMVQDGLALDALPN